jgi:SMC interacting uncharacterized protein involved in chromosome segregation
MIMAKPNKRQKAILQLLNIIEGEGLHYAIVEYGLDEQLRVLKDDRLTNLVLAMKETTKEWEEHLEELKAEVEQFSEDDVDF